MKKVSAFFFYFRSTWLQSEVACQVKFCYSKPFSVRKFQTFRFLGYYPCFALGRQIIDDDFVISLLQRSKTDMSLKYQRQLYSTPVKHSGTITTRITRRRHARGSLAFKPAQSYCSVFLRIDLPKTYFFSVTERNLEVASLLRAKVKVHSGLLMPHFVCFA